MPIQFLLGRFENFKAGKGSIIARKICLVRDIIINLELEKEFQLPFFIVPRTFCVTMLAWKRKISLKQSLALGLGHCFWVKESSGWHSSWRHKKELTTITIAWLLFRDGWKLRLYVQVYESSLERLVGGVIWNGRHFIPLSMKMKDLIYREEILWFL